MDSLLKHSGLEMEKNPIKLIIGNYLSGCREANFIHKQQICKNVL